MKEIFPEQIRNLPQADIPFSGVTAYLSQAENHQILFWEFNEDVKIPEHSHEAQWDVVLAGKIDLTINGVEQTYSKGDCMFILKGAKHSAKVYAGYAGITFFNEKDRWKAKETKKM